MEASFDVLAFVLEIETMMHSTQMNINEYN